MFAKQAWLMLLLVVLQVALTVAGAVELPINDEKSPVFKRAATLPDPNKKDDNLLMLSILTGQQKELAKKIDKVQRDMMTNQMEINTEFQALETAVSTSTQTISFETTNIYKNITMLYNMMKTMQCELTMEIALQNLEMTTLNGKKYLFSRHQSDMSWENANKFCKLHHMDLVSIDSQQEWDALKPHTANWPWSAGSDAIEEGKWKWVSTGEDITFFGGKGSMADSTAENCLYIFDQFWSDFDCSATRPFICEVNTVCGSVMTPENI